MKKIICRTLCLVFAVIMMLPIIAGCNKKKTDIYVLGDYSITEKEYVYLTGMFKKSIMMSLDPSLTDKDLSYKMDNGMTIAAYIEVSYREVFEQSVLTLLYSQSMFDRLGLTLSSTDEAKIKSAANEVALFFANEYYGEKSIDAFNRIASEYGFDYDTLYSVYKKQYKEAMVREHILGKNNENITATQKERFYQDNYLRYQTLIVNTTYKEYIDSNGEISMLPLTEDEVAEKKLLVTELTQLLVNKNKDYNYILLADKLDMTYEELWELYDEDNRKYGHYPYGCYQVIPPKNENGEYQTTDNVLSAAATSKIGAVMPVTAKRYFSQGGSFKDENGETTTVNPGDYFDYGTIFVKKLSLDQAPYEKTENRDFFGSSFKNAVANYVFMQARNEHVNSLAYSTQVNENIMNFTFENVKANELDYYYLNQ